MIYIKIAQLYWIINILNANHLIIPKQIWIVMKWYKYVDWRDMLNATRFHLLIFLDQSVDLETSL